MNNFLLSIGFLLVFVLSVLFAGPHFVDWNEYRNSFEAQASKIVGREVRVGGNVTLRMLPTPYVRFENVRIADLDGRFADPFLRIETFTMLLSVPPLLKGEIEASGVELDRPRFHLVIDDDRGPNWKGLGAGEAGLSVLPEQVAFKSVKVKNGIVILKVSGDKKLVELNDVNVDLSATTMLGPYKLQGTYLIGGQLREVQLATGIRLENGGLPIKTALTNPKNRATYKFDGLLRDGASDPNLDGRLTAVLPIFGSGFALPIESRMKRAVGAAAELSASLKGDVREFKLDDLKISFESEGRPQSLSGSAKIDWQDGLALNASLRAIWLDLDRIAGFGGKQEYPWVVLRSIMSGFEANWPSADKINIQIGMDQATLGGDAINSLDVQLFKSERELRLKNLSAELPGAGHIRMAGRIIEGARPAFIGDVVLRGRSFQRFRRWAMHDWLKTSDQNDGYFALNGKLDVNQERLLFSRFKGEYEETNFTGTGSYQFDESRLFNISIDSEKIDLHSTPGANLTLGALVRVWSDYLSTTPKKNAETATGQDVKWWQYFRNGRIAVKVGQLVTPHEQFRDVDVDLNLAPQLIRVTEAKFETTSGALFKVDGKVDLSGKMARGKLNVIVDAEALPSVQSVARFLDVPKSVLNIEALSPELAPLRFAGIVKIGTRDGTSTEASLDGSLGTTRATLLAHLIGPPSNWKTSQLDFVGFLKSDEGIKLLAQIFSSTSDQFGAGDHEGDKAPGRLALRLSGVPEKGMATVVDLEAPGLKAQYRGNLALVDDKIQIEGQASFDARDARHALKLVSMDRLLGHGEASSLSGKGLIVGEAGVFQINDGWIRLGNSEFLGQGNIEFVDSGVEIEIAAKTKSVSLAGLIGSVVAAEAHRDVAAGQDNRRSGNRRSGNRRNGRQNIAGSEFSWSEKPFDFKVLDRISGSVELAARQIDLGQGYGVSGGLLKLSFGRDAVKISNISGKFGGGSLDASLNISRAAAGVTVRGEGRIKNADLREFKRRYDSGGKAVRRSVAQGLADVEFKFGGRGLSPRGVMAVLAGSGHVDFKDLALMHFSPEAVEVASNAMLISKRRPRTKELEASIVENLSKGVLRIGSRPVKFKISDGTLTVEEQSIKKGGTDVKVTSYVDLNRLLIDSEWIIKPKVKIKAALQPVSLVYNGGLSELETLQPRIDAEQLTRELVVRKLELDVEALEALRERDDQLAREAAKAAAEQGGDWGVTETIIEGEGASLSGDDGVGVPARQSSAAQGGTAWKSSIAPVGPYGSAYDPMQAVAPKKTPVLKKRFVRRRKKAKKKVFNPFFQF